MVPRVRSNPGFFIPQFQPQDPRHGAVPEAFDPRVNFCLAGLWAISPPPRVFHYDNLEKELVNATKVRDAQLFLCVTVFNVNSVMISMSCRVRLAWWALQELIRHIGVCVMQNFIRRHISFKDRTLRLPAMPFSQYLTDFAANPNGLCNVLLTYMTDEQRAQVDTIRVSCCSLVRSVWHRW